MAEAKTLNEILEGRFIKRVLTEEAQNIDSAQVKYMAGAGFEDAGWFSGRSFDVSESALAYAQQLRHRFVDMRTRNSKKGKVRKKAHPVYNKIIYGHYNNIVRQLKFGFTDAVKEELHQLEE